LDWAGGSLFGGRAISGIWIRGVSAAGGDWAAGVPVVPQRAIDSQVATIAGYVLLLMSLPSLLSLWHFPSVREALPAEGCWGR